MEKINAALTKIENVLKAVGSFETQAAGGDFEKRFLTRWPDIRGALESVKIIKDELQNVQDNKQTKG